MNLDFFSAFIIGLVGSGHCLAMCGGISTMLTSATKPRKKTTTQGDIELTVEKSSQNPPISIIVSYHAGRIGSYMLIGAIVAFTGSFAAKNIGFPITGLRLISSLFIIFLGLYLGRWLMWLTHIESLGKRLWQYLSPLAKYVIPVNNKRKALGLGALWGWLPCGLVYSMLTWSMASGDVITGSALMLCFGLGTLPALFALSLSLSSIESILVKPIFKKIMATILVCYGIYSFLVAYQVMF